MKKHIIISILFLLLIQYFSCNIISVSPSLKKGDWPQYRADAGRCGYTPHNLPSDLSLRWKYEQPPPSAAWKGPGTRMLFDYAYEPVISGKKLYFGSSTDCKIYALDTITGEECWSFFTAAPVRFAPALWKNRLFAVSDDGYLYCLSADDGNLIWKKRGGPDDSMVLGNERMVSRWPVRGGVVIKDDILYFGAGIWPTEEIYIYALNPKTGEVLWVNDHCGNMDWDQQHPGARAKSGISAQGYLAAAGNHLLISTGRGVPAALKIKTGELDYFHLRKQHAYGGSDIVATDKYFFMTSGNKQNDIVDIKGPSHAICNNEDGEILIGGNQLNSQSLSVSQEKSFFCRCKKR